MKAKSVIALLLAVTLPQVGLSLTSPILPELAHAFSVGETAVVDTMNIYMAGYALSMLLSGWLAERFDPKHLLIAGFCLFTVGSVAAAAAGAYPLFLLARFLQALGGTSTTVLARLIVREQFPAGRRVRVLADLSMAIAATPAVVPLLGGALATILPWRAMFLMMAAVAVLDMTLVAVRVGARAPGPRGSLALPLAVRRWGRALRDPHFMAFALMISGVWMTYFLFISQAPNAYRIGFGVSALGYGLAAAVVAGGYVAGSFVVRRSRGADLRHILHAAPSVVGAAVVTVAVMLVVAGGAFAVNLALCFVLATLVGGFIPLAQAGGMEAPSYTSTTSGLFFFLQMIAGAAYSPLVSRLSPGTPRSLVFFMLLPMAMVGLVALAALRITRPAPIAAAPVVTDRPAED